jgi:hypothetical protein
MAMGPEETICGIKKAAKNDDENHFSNRKKKSLKNNLKKSKNEFSNNLKNKSSSDSSNAPPSHHHDPTRSQFDDNLKLFISSIYPAPHVPKQHIFSLVNGKNIFPTNSTNSNLTPSSYIPYYSIKTQSIYNILSSNQREISSKYPNNAKFPKLLEPYFDSFAPPSPSYYINLFFDFGGNNSKHTQKLDSFQLCHFLEQKYSSISYETNIPYQYIDPQYTNDAVTWYDNENELITDQKEQFGKIDQKNGRNFDQNNQNQNFSSLFSGVENSHLWTSIESIEDLPRSGIIAAIYQHNNGDFNELVSSLIPFFQDEFNFNQNEKNLNFFYNFVNKFQNSNFETNYALIHSHQFSLDSTYQYLIDKHGGINNRIYNPQNNIFGEDFGNNFDKKKMARSSALFPEHSPEEKKASFFESLLETTTDDGDDGDSDDSDGNGQNDDGDQENNPNVVQNFANLPQPSLLSPRTHNKVANRVFSLLDLQQSIFHEYNTLIDENCAIDDDNNGDGFSELYRFTAEPLPNSQNYINNTVEIDSGDGDGDSDSGDDGLDESDVLKMKFQHDGFDHYIYTPDSTATPTASKSSILTDNDIEAYENHYLRGFFPWGDIFDDLGLLLGSHLEKYKNEEMEKIEKNFQNSPKNLKSNHSSLNYIQKRLSQLNENHIPDFVTSTVRLCSLFSSILSHFSSFLIASLPTNQLFIKYLSILTSITSPPQFDLFFPKSDHFCPKFNTFFPIISSIFKDSLTNLRQHVENHQCPPLIVSGYLHTGCEIENYGNNFVDIFLKNYQKKALIFTQFLTTTQNSPILPNQSLSDSQPVAVHDIPFLSTLVPSLSLKKVVCDGFNEDSNEAEQNSPQISLENPQNFENIVTNYPKQIDINNYESIYRIVVDKDDNLLFESTSTIIPTQPSTPSTPREPIIQYTWLGTCSNQTICLFNDYDTFKAIILFLCQNYFLSEKETYIECLSAELTHSQNTLKRSHATALLQPGSIDSAIFLSQNSTKIPFIFNFLKTRTSPNPFFRFVDWLQKSFLNLLQKSTISKYHKNLFWSHLSPDAIDKLIKQSKPLISSPLSPLSPLPPSGLLNASNTPSNQSISAFSAQNSSKIDQNLHISTPISLSTAPLPPGGDSIEAVQRVGNGDSQSDEFLGKNAPKKPLPPLRFNTTPPDDINLNRPFEYVDITSITPDNLHLLELAAVVVKVQNDLQKKDAENLVKNGGKNGGKFGSLLASPNGQFGASPRHSPNNSGNMLKSNQGDGIGGQFDVFDARNMNEIIENYNDENVSNLNSKSELNKIIEIEYEKYVKHLGQKEETNVKETCTGKDNNITPSFEAPIDTIAPNNQSDDLGDQFHTDINGIDNDIIDITTGKETQYGDKNQDKMPEKITQLQTALPPPLNITHFETSISPEELVDFIYRPYIPFQNPYAIPADNPFVLNLVFFRSLLQQNVKKNKTLTRQELLILASTTPPQTFIDTIDSNKIYTLDDILEIRQDNRKLSLQLTTPQKYGFTFYFFQSAFFLLFPIIAQSRDFIAIIKTYYFLFLTILLIGLTLDFLRSWIFVPRWQRNIVDAEWQKLVVADKEAEEKEKNYSIEILKLVKTLREKRKNMQDNGNIEDNGVIDNADGSGKDGGKNESGNDGDSFDVSNTDPNDPNNISTTQPSPSTDHNTPTTPHPEVSDPNVVVYKYNKITRIFMTIFYVTKLFFLTFINPNLNVEPHRFDFLDPIAPPVQEPIQNPPVVNNNNNNPPQ